MTTEIKVKEDYALPSVGCAPLYAHLALRASCVGPLRVHRSGGEWCCAAAVTHMYMHTYTYMLTARGVYVVRYPTPIEWTSRPQAATRPSREIRVCRTKGGEREGWD